MPEIESLSRQQAVQLARDVVASQPVYIDTETTGLEKTDEVVEISVIDWDGSVLISSLVKPVQPIPPAASRIHGISNEMVHNCQLWPLLWPQVRPMLAGRVIAGYNIDFDLRMMQQSHARYRLPWREVFSTVDVLKIYSKYRSEGFTSTRTMRFYRLEEAGRALGIPLPNAHRSTADALLTRAVLHAIAGLPYQENGRA